MSEIELLIQKSEESDVKLLLRSKEEAKRVLVEDPTNAGALSALERVEKMLSRAREKNDVFKNVEEVLEYLTRELGRKVGKSKLYEDKRAGFLRASKDGSFSRRAVNVYAATLPLASGAPEPQSDKAAALALRRALAEAEKAEESAKLMARKREILEGKYIARGQLELLLAGRAAVFEQGLLSLIERDAPELVEVAGGRPENSRALIERLRDKIESLLSDYTRTDVFEVEFEGELDSEFEDETETELDHIDVENV